MRRATDEEGRPSVGSVRHTQHGEEQRAQLVRAAFDLIAERGVEGLRTRDVAARAGITVATLHYYFPTKEQLIRAVVDLAAEMFRRPARDAGRSNDDPLTELRDDLRGTQTLLRESPELFTVWLELTMRASRDSTINAMMRQTETVWRKHVSAYLQAGVDDGVFRSNLDVPAAAMALVALQKGLALQAMLLCAPLANDHFSVEIEHWLTGSPR